MTTISQIESPPPPRLTGDAAADVSLIAGWANSLYRALVISNPLLQRMDRISEVEIVAAFTALVVDRPNPVSLMTGSETLAQTIAKVNELVPLAAKATELATEVSRLETQVASLTDQLNAVIAAADRE